MAAVTLAAILATVGAIADRAMAQPIGAPHPLAQLAADARVLRRCAARIPGVVVTFGASRWHILCPASATFDAAEALRLELVAVAPPGVAVDVEIAAGGGGSAEDEAGRRLFASERRERMAGGGCSSSELGECSTCSSSELGECSTCSPEHEAYCNGFACAGCNPPTACACHGGTA